MGTIVFPQRPAQRVLQIAAFLAPLLWVLVLFFRDLDNRQIFADVVKNHVLLAPTVEKLFTFEKWIR